MSHWTPRQIDNQWRESPWERQERQRKARAAARRKPLSELSKEELREAINDPLGPDYKGYQDDAISMLANRSKP